MSASVCTIVLLHVLSVCFSISVLSFMQRVREKRRQQTEGNKADS